MASEMIGYCRICAQRNQDLVPVFGEQGRCLQLYLKLKLCLQVTVMKNDHLPTAICLGCLTKLEVCHQLFELRLQGENEFQRYKNDTLDLSITKAVMHGEQRSWEPAMEEDMREHPKRRKMRRHWRPEEPKTTEPSVSTTFHQESQPEECKYDRFMDSQYGGLPLLVDAIEQQSLANAGVSAYGPPASTSSFETSASASSFQTSGYEVNPSVSVHEVKFTEPLSEDTTETKTLVTLQAPAPQPIPTSFTPPALASPISESSDDSQSTKECKQASPGETEVKQENLPGQSRTAKKEIPCDFCGKCFTHTGDLNKHRRIHTGERPYHCEQCDRKFSHASNLLRHRKIHSGERPFVCKQCGKGFSRKDKMLSHSKSATCSRYPSSPGSSSSQQ